MRELLLFLLFLLSLSVFGSFSFVPFTHRRIFDGEIGKGIWVANDFSYYGTDLSGARSGLSHIQLCAIKEGYFVPENLNKPLHLFSAEEARQCLKGKKIGVAGDSYMIQLYIGLADILLDDASNIEIIGSSMRNRVLQSQVKRIRRLFNGTDPYRISLTYDFSVCKHSEVQCILRELAHSNRTFDALLLSYVGQSSANAYGSYVLHLSELFQCTDAKRPINWVTGPSFDANRISANETKRARFSQVNSLAFELQEETVNYDGVKIPILDVYSLTAQCKWANCSVDGGHRSRFVNRMKAQLLLNNWCQNDAGSRDDDASKWSPVMLNAGYFPHGIREHRRSLRGAQSTDSLAPVNILSSSARIARLNRPYCRIMWEANRYGYHTIKHS